MPGRAAPAVRHCRRIIAGLVLPLLLASPAPGQAPNQPPRAGTESVTVTGTKSREVMRDFARAMAVPTHTMDKLPRWSGSGICPIAAGLHPAFAEFILLRLRQVAGQVGAPVNGKASCKPNIEIAFTAAPQTLMDTIKVKNSPLLGYYDNLEQRDRLAIVRHPIQAWYMTATQDLMGNTQVDGARVAGTGMEYTYLCPPPAVGVCTLHLSSAHGAVVTGTRLGDGQRSGFYHVLIVVDPGQVRDYGMGGLADYIAMLALTQVAALDGCQQLPSIVNLLAKACDRKSESLTENDTAYLRGLYKMGAGRTLQSQRDEIAYQMEQDLTADRAANSDKR